jgi:hypothetical protein
MYTFGKRIGLAALAGLIVVGIHAPDAWAQRVQRAGNLVNPGSPGYFPFFRVNPNLNIQQAAYNTSLAGHALSQVPPWAFFPGNFNNLNASGFNNLPGSLQAAVAASVANGALNPVTLSANTPFNPFALSTGALANPGAVSPFALSTNPYAFAGAAGGYGALGGTASLTSSGLPSNSGYDSAAYGSYGSNPYAGYPYGIPDSFGGYLRGGADVINAQGRFLVSRQQAGILREERAQKTIENHRRRVLQYLWDLDHIPTLQSLQERRDRINLRHYLNNAGPSEVTSATALNAILADLRKLPNGTNGPRIPLNEQTLQNINVQAPGTNGNAGLLKNADGLPWPLALQGPEYKDQIDLINSNLADAVSGAAKNNVDPTTLRAMDRAVAAMQDTLRRNIRDLPIDQYTDASNFLANLAAGLNVLSHPNAAKQLRTPKGATVADLVQWMNQNGMVFAPAVNGQEADYQALHQALVSYDNGIHGRSPQVATERETSSEKKKSEAKEE